MKVIVIGATGTIGSVAVRHMLADGHTVTAFMRPSGFANGPAVGKFQDAVATTLKRLRLKMVRDDIAGFPTRQLTDTTDRQCAVGI